VSQVAPKDVQGAPIVVLCLHGPNLNLLGRREPQIYGATTLEEVDAALVALGVELGVAVECVQSNHEGALIDAVQAGMGRVDGLLINPGGYTHTSVALRDAVSALAVPAIEVHISNVYRREAFRHVSLFADVCQGRLMGFGTAGYLLALRGVVEIVNSDRARRRTLTNRGDAP